MSNKNPNPLVLAGLKRKEDPLKRRGRAYALGERNPKTLPGSGKDAETFEQNRERSAAWTRLRKQLLAGKFVGSKY